MTKKRADLWSCADLWSKHADLWFTENFVEIQIIHEAFCSKWSLCTYDILSFLFNPINNYSDNQFDMPNSQIASIEYSNTLYSQNNNTNQHNVNEYVIMHM